MGRTLVTVMTAAAGLAAAVVPAASAAAPSPANRCQTLTGAGPLAGRTFFVKPTTLRLTMLAGADGRVVTAAGRDATPGPAAEWPLRGRVMTVAGHAYRLRDATGCRRFPEAELGAHGTPARGRVRGFVDAHVHVTADLRAGGQVISGRPFSRYGIADALGRDAEDHGPDGSLDITGNLLRTGAPDGTHDTSGWPSFTGWPTRDTLTHQQVYWRWLQRAWLGGLRLIVAQTVEDRPLCDIEPRRSHSCDETATIELETAELRALQSYVDAQAGGRGRGFFRIVTGPAQARRVIERGRLAVVIGAESSDLFGCGQRLGVAACDRAQVDRGIARLRRAGVRSVFLAHWVDNALGGAALEPGAKGTFISLMQVSSTGAPFSTGACPAAGQGTSCNTRGLTPLGRYAVGRLMDAHMLIEADHLSEVGREQLLAMAEARRYPLVSSHTGTGGTWTTAELRRLHAVGGFATATLDPAPALAAKVLELRRRFGGPVGLGSDVGGFADLPGSDPGRRPLAYPFRSADGRVGFGRQRTGTRAFDINADGMAHYGLLPDLLAQVRREPHGRRALQVLSSAAGAYLRTWRATGAR